jgi:hypothetical protein
VGTGEGLDPLGACRGEMQAHDPLVVVIVQPFDESGRNGTVDEFDDAVMAQQQVFGDLADRRWRAPVATDGQKQLVLRRCQPDALGLVLAPPLEPPKPVAKGEQSREVVVPELPTARCHIGSR